MRLVCLAVAGGLAFRRGDAQTAQQLLEELRPLALASGEPHRIIPMAGVVLPLLALTDDFEKLRSLSNEIVTVVDRRWPAVLDAVPVVRALAAAGETQLLARTTESIRETPNVSAQMHTALMTGEGLLALAQGRPGEAFEELETATEREQQLGRTYDAACLALDLARALEAKGDTAAAQEMQSRAASVLEPLGCVNPF
jgi:tetratricopeptide (TPR) repeat protein